MIASVIRNGEAVRRRSGPPFDRSSIPAYAMLAILIAVAASAAVFSGFSVPDPTFIYEIAGLGAFFIAESILFRMARWSRLASALETSILWLLLGLSTSLALIPLTAVSGPLRDELLISWDLALGYNWMRVYGAVAQFPWLMDVLRLAYRSFMQESLGILVVLSFLGQEDRAWRTVGATGIGLVATAVIYPFFPADAAYNHFGLHYADNFASIIHSIKAGGRVIALNELGGLVTFPSFHVTAAVLTAWAAWTIRPIRWPMVVINIVVSLSAIFIGAHYFVDVLGGAVIAWGSIIAMDHLHAICAPKRRLHGHDSSVFRSVRTADVQDGHAAVG